MISSVRFPRLAVGKVYCVASAELEQLPTSTVHTGIFSDGTGIHSDGKAPSRDLNLLAILVL